MRAQHISSSKIRNGGFTLVELLVSIVIIGIIGSMVSIALSGANRQALETRSRSMTDTLNLLILQIYEEEAEKRVELPAGFSDQPSRALAALQWKRDWLRCALPERREDVADPPVAVPYPNTGDPTGVDGDIFPPGTDNKLTVPLLSAGTNATGIRAQQILSYQSYIARSIGVAKGVSVSTFAQLTDGNANNGEWTAQHQSAECLYVILSTHVINGVPASEVLRQRDVGDLDEDGMPEVLDPWGNPVGFMRWPVGLSLTPEWNVQVESPESTSTRSQWADLAAMKDKLGRDNLDLLYADPRYLDNRTVAQTSFPQAEDPFPLHPIVVMAGADGEFDLYGLDDDTTVSPAAPPVIDYTPGGLPNTSPSFVNPPFFPTNMPFVDPYMDGSEIKDKLGARVDTDTDGIDDSADNVLPAFVL